MGKGQLKIGKLAISNRQKLASLRNIFIASLREKKIKQ